MVGLGCGWGRTFSGIGGCGVGQCVVWRWLCLCLCLWFVRWTCDDGAGGCRGGGLYVLSLMASAPSNTFLFWEHHVQTQRFD